MKTEEFFNWLHDLRYSRMICLLLPSAAVMGYPIPVIKSGDRALLLPFFEPLPDGGYRPCGMVGVPFGGTRILAYSAAQWLQSETGSDTPLYSGDAQRMDNYYSRLAAWDSADAAQCELLQLQLLDMLPPGTRQFYQSIIPEKAGLK